MSPHFNFGELDFQESVDLPARTLVAPLSIIREIRTTVGKVPINLVVGESEVVLVSTDLFEAYTEWDGQRTDFDPLCN